MARVVAGSDDDSVEGAAAEVRRQSNEKRSSVDLPLPEGPVTVTNSPGTTVSSIPVGRVLHAPDTGRSAQRRWRLVPRAASTDPARSRSYRGGS
jgi:hypothetical protein